MKDDLSLWPVRMTRIKFLWKNDHQLKDLVIVKQILFVSWEKCITNKKKNMHTDVKVLSINWGSFDLLRTVNINLHIVNFNFQFFFSKLYLLCESLSLWMLIMFTGQKVLPYCRRGLWSRSRGRKGGKVEML